MFQTDMNKDDRCSNCIEYDLDGYHNCGPITHLKVYGYDGEADSDRAIESAAKVANEITSEMSNVLDDIANECWVNAEAHGFHKDGSNNSPAVWVANLHGEISEFWEAYRKGKLDAPCDKPIPLTCADEELADEIIRCFDVAKQKGLDIGRAVAIKHQYNITRPFLHGDKLA